jgi:hypothetical protein
MIETGLSRAEAERAVRRRYPALSPAPTQGRVATAGGKAEAKLDRRARELPARERLTYAVAYVRVLNSDARLYLAYLKEQQAKLEAGARRG